VTLKGNYKSSSPNTLQSLDVSIVYKHHPAFRSCGTDPEGVPASAAHPQGATSVSPSLFLWSSLFVENRVRPPRRLLRPTAQSKPWDDHFSDVCAPRCKLRRSTRWSVLVLLKF
jgi:hypothetical protein